MIFSSPTSGGEHMRYYDGKQHCLKNTVLLSIVSRYIINFTKTVWLSFEETRAAKVYIMTLCIRIDAPVTLQRSRLDEDSLS